MTESPPRLPPPRHLTATERDPRGEALAVLDEMRRVEADGAVIELWCPGAGPEDWARVIAWLYDRGRVDSLTDPSGAPSGPAPLVAAIVDPDAASHEWLLRFHVGTSTWCTPFGDHDAVYFWGGPEDVTTLAQVQELLAWARELAELLDRPVLLLPETPRPESTRPMWRSDQDERHDPARLPAPRHRPPWAAPDVDIVAEFRAWVAEHRPALEDLGLLVELSGPPPPWAPGVPEYLRRVADLQLWAPRRAAQLAVGEDGQLDLYVLDLDVDLGDPEAGTVVSAYFDVCSSAGLTDALHTMLAATLEDPDPPMPAPPRPFVTAPRHWEPRTTTQPWPAPSLAHHGGAHDRGADRRPPPPPAPPGAPPDPDRLARELSAATPQVPTVTVDNPPSPHGGDVIGELVAFVASSLGGLVWSFARDAEFSGRPHGVAALHRLDRTEHGLSSAELVALLAGVGMHRGELVGAVQTSPAGRWRAVVCIDAVRGREFDVRSTDERLLHRLRTVHGARDVPGGDLVRRE